jgi:NADH-quinone oxidoreductase subunit J
VTQKNLTRALLSVIVFFFGIAALFFSLRAEVLGAVQILIYVGAVAVMTVYAIVLTRSADGGIERRKGLPILATLIAGTMATLMATAVLQSKLVTDHIAPGPVPVDVTERLALSMLGTFVLPFEIASLLLTAAMIGAVVIALDELRASSSAGGEQRNEGGRP